LITGLLLPTILYAEDLIGLPRTEVSKNFDMEINNLNNMGTKHHSLNKLNEADENLKKATNLAQQLRDPSLGVTSFNRALVLHQLHKRNEAEKYFTIAKRCARGDMRILNSQLLKNYTN
jgi:hypothetical protein